LDLANVNFSGPARGLFDVLLGTNQQPKEAEGDGEGFSGLMDAIKAMTEGDKSSRTDEETATEKGAIDYRALGLSGFFPAQGAQAMPTPIVPEGTGGEQGEGNPAGSSPLGMVDAKLVNGMLKEASLPTLSPEEMKLLEKVNEKVAELNAEEGALSQDVQKLLADIQQASGGEGSEALPVVEGSAEAKFVKELDRKGVDTRGLRGEGASTETAKSAERPLVSTESFLQMQKQGAPKKEEGDSKLAEAGRELPKANSLPNQNVTAQAITEKGGKKDLFSGMDKDQVKLGADRDEAKPNMVSPFSQDLLQSLKSDGNVKEVFLNGTSAQAVKAELLGEVNQSVSMTALKGGGEMRIVIRPDGLGEVKLKVEAKDGKIGVHMIAENEEVAKVLQGGSRELESSLRDQSLSLAKFEVAVKADAPVAAADTGSKLAEQFLGDQKGSQQSWGQPDFSQGGRDQGRFANWDGSSQQRQPSSGRLSDEGGSIVGRRYAGAPRSSAAVNSSRDGSRRLDVVA
jgi:flagellar hook-length control protein FliK